MAKGTPVRTRGRGARVEQRFPKSVVTVSYESNALENLRQLAVEIRQNVLRSAAHAGAIVFYNEARLRVPVDEGTLFGSIYRFHLDKKSGANGQYYAIGPNKKKAPHWYNVEYGHWRVNKVIFSNGRWIATKERLPSPVWVNGRPYMRPTYDSKAQVALNAMRERLKMKYAEVVNGIQA